jgi:hypothetical protein
MDYDSQLETSGTELWAAASNVAQDQRDHAAKMAYFALSMIKVDSVLSSRMWSVCILDVYIDTHAYINTCIQTMHEIHGLTSMYTIHAHVHVHVHHTYVCTHIKDIHVLQMHMSSEYEYIRMYVSTHTVWAYTYEFMNMHTHTHTHTRIHALFLTHMAFLTAV